MLDVRLKKDLEGFSIDVSLRLDDELLVLFGPSGAGKTQILKMISGLIKPDEGSVSVGPHRLFDSKSSVDIPIRNRKIGYLFQDYALFPHMTVFGNIAYAIDGPLKGPGKEKVRELVSVMRLTGLEDRYPHELSGGQKQRTALARTLASDPKLLLLDEPFSALDYQVREKLRTDLVNIHRMFPVTTILVTHDLEEAFMLGKRIAVINNGRIEQEGTREEVFYRPRTKNVARFMGVRNIFDGRIQTIEGSHAIIYNKGIGSIKAVAAAPGLREGQDVSFCIRPEEVIIIRPDKAAGKVQDNILEGEIVSTVGKGSTHILFLKTGSEDTLIKIELPNFVLRKLGLATGSHIRVSLKKENIWVIP